MPRSLFWTDARNDSFSESPLGALIDSQEQNQLRFSHSTRSAMERAHHDAPRSYAARDNGRMKSRVVRALTQRESCTVRDDVVSRRPRTISLD